MSKVNVNTNTETTAEQIAQTEQLFNIKSESGEFIDMTDNLDDAKVIADNNPGSSVYNDETDEVVYTTKVEEVVEAIAEPASESELIPVAEVIEEVIQEELNPVKEVEQPTPAIEPFKADVKEVAIEDIVEVEKPVAKEEVKTNKIVMPGMIVRLDKQVLYKSAHIPQPFKLMSGIVFIFDAECVNGRYRVTNNVNNCGGDIKTVIGYIPAEYIK